MRPRHVVSQLERHYRLVRGQIVEIEGKIIAAGVSGPDGRGRGLENDVELGYIALGTDFVGGLLEMSAAGYRDLFPDLGVAATEGN